MGGVWCLGFVVYGCVCGGGGLFLLAWFSFMQPVSSPEEWKNVCHCSLYPLEVMNAETKRDFLLRDQNALVPNHTALVRESWKHSGTEKLARGEKDYTVCLFW